MRPIHLLSILCVGFLFGCSDRSSVVGLYADPTPGPEPEAVKYVQVSDSADVYNIQLHDAQGFLLRQTSVPAASFGQGVTMDGCRIHPEGTAQAIRLTPLYGGHEGTPHLLYKTVSERLPVPATGKLRLHRLFCVGAVPRMTIYAAHVDNPITDSQVIHYDVITDASEYGYIAPDEACNEQLTAEEEKEYYEQLAFQDAILYLAPGKYVVYAYTEEIRRPMSCHNSSGELTEIEIRPAKPLRQRWTTIPYTGEYLCMASLIGFVNRSVRSLPTSLCPKLPSNVWSGRLIRAIKRRSRYLLQMDAIRSGSGTCHSWIHSIRLTASVFNLRSNYAVLPGPERCWCLTDRRRNRRMICAGSRGFSGTRIPRGSIYLPGDPALRPGKPYNAIFYRWLADKQR